jgi:hypothetical protein
MATEIMFNFVENRFENMVCHDRIAVRHRRYKHQQRKRFWNFLVSARETGVQIGKALVTVSVLSDLSR